MVYLAWTDDRDGPDGDIYFTLGSPDPAGVKRPPERWPGGPGPVSVSPNPFTSSVRLLVPSSEFTTYLGIYDPAGRLVRRLEVVGSAVEWGGRDAAGRRLGAGIYFCRVVTGAGARTTKVVLLN